MRWGGILALVVVVAGAGIYLATQTGVLNFGAFTSRCRHDHEIPQPVRDEASAAALRFVEAILKPDASPAYQMATKELKGAVTADAFAKLAKQIQDQGTFANLKVDQLYFPELQGSKVTRVMCDTASANPDEHWVYLDAQPGETQIDAIVLGSTRNTDWAFTIWLLKRDGVWQVHGYYASSATLVGQSAADLLKQAEAQDQKGNSFNATMLYVASGSLLNRGPFFQLGLKQTYDTKFEKHKPAPELTGEPPFAWLLDGKTYAVEKVTILGVEKKLVLQLLWRDSEWNGTDDGDAERRNRAFLDAFMKAHPEYKETFGILVARLLPKTGERGWGTVYDAEKGYDTKPTAGSGQ